jgi:hypothetical protein
VTLSNRPVVTRQALAAAKAEAARRPFAGARGRCSRPGALDSAGYWALVLGEPPSDIRVHRLQRVDTVMWTRPNRPCLDAAYGGPADVLVIPDGILPVASLGRFRPDADFLRELASLGRLILFDRRGLGSSSLAWAPLTLRDWADEASVVLQEVGAAPAVVVGLAEGAMTGTALAALIPDRWRRWSFSTRRRAPHWRR